MQKFSADRGAGEAEKRTEEKNIIPVNMLEEMKSDTIDYA